MDRPTKRDDDEFDRALAPHVDIDRAPF